MASNDTLQTIAGVLGNVLEWYGKYTLSVAHMICSYNAESVSVHYDLLHCSHLVNNMYAHVIYHIN